MMNNYDLTYGQNKDGKLISINEALRGLDCGCTCPHCGMKLEAKKGQIRRHHFAHHNPNPNHGSNFISVCKRECYDSTMHRLAEEIVEEEKCIMAPSYDRIPAKTLTFESVEIEKRNDRKDLQPDIVGITSDGKRYQIEIRLSHPTNKEKQKKLIESRFLSMEVDIRQQPMDKEKLKKFLLETVESRKWLNNPEYEEEIERRKEEERRRKRKTGEVGQNKKVIDAEIPWITENRKWNREYIQQKPFQTDSSTWKWKPITWKESCFCLCPKENPSIESYYDVVTKSMNAIFYQDGEKHSVIVNWRRQGNVFYVVHAVTINGHNTFVYTVVSWDGNKIIHETSKQYHNDYYAALEGNKKIRLR